MISSSLSESVVTTLCLSLRPRKENIPAAMDRTATAEAIRVACVGECKNCVRPYTNFGTHHAQMFPQGVFDGISSYSCNASHGYWLRCSKLVIQENKRRALSEFRESVTNIVDGISGGVLFTVKANDWCSFLEHPNDGLRFHMQMDLAWMTCMIDSDDEDDWVGDALAHLDKLEEQGEVAVDEIKEVLNETRIRYNLDMDEDSLGGRLIVFYKSF